MSKPLENILNQLGLIEHNAVFFREEKNGKVFNGFSSELQKKIEIIKPDAYFIFNQQPFVLFFDLSLNKNSERENEIHKQVWSFDNSPVIFIIKHNEIQIFNAFSFDKNNNRLEEIKLSEDEINENFSFWNLQSGFTWKNWYLQEFIEKKKNTRKRANQQLFENIKQVREALTNKNAEKQLSDDDANVLILRLIFIRYLIDREVSIDKKFISGKNITEKRLSFCELIEKPHELNLLFDKLNANFNGVLFKNTNITLTKTQSKDLAQVFKGERPEEGSLFFGSDFYFEIFDFSIIPVEVISGIYESLIDVETRKLNSAVYTPSFLVEYILTDTVEKYLNDNNSSECKIFDPSVGSGIFLVQSLRKMIDKEIKLNKKANKKQFSERIREIATNNLFGIDTNPQALKVTCFSIYIALLDYQEPKDIDKYEFPNFINENLFEANFFDEENLFNEIIKKQKLNFILGNPPWKNGSKDKYHIDYLQNHNLLDIVSDYQLAQSFILRIKDFSNFQPECSLIITSKALYNNNAVSFKLLFLKEFHLYKCFDLSPVRRFLFHGADNPAMILRFQYAKNLNTFDNIVLHQSLKYNLFIKYYKSFVLEKGDVKNIKQGLFYDYPWMFKVALYGNSIDYSFLKRINNNSVSIERVLIDNYSINAGNGIHKGTPKDYSLDLIGFHIVETKNIGMYYTKITSNNQTLKKDDVFLERGRTVELFKGTKILLTRRPKKESEINISYCEDSVVFRNSAYGIPFNNNLETSFYTFSLLISKLYTYYQYLTSSNWGIYHPEINKTEYLSFPFIEPNEEKKKELVDLINQFLQPFKKHYEQFNLGEPQRDENIFNKINEEINKLYSVKDYEKDLIDYVLEVSRYQFQENKQEKFTKEINNDIPFLEKYAEVFVEEFSKIYTDEYLQIEVYPLEHFIAMNFVFYKEKPKNNKNIVFPTNKKDETEILKRLAKNLSISQITNTEDSSKNLFIQKDIKGFEENSFYIIKPNEYKCWHRAMAWYDVAEFIEAIENAELSHLKNKINDF